MQRLKCAAFLMVATMLTSCATPQLTTSPAANHEIGSKQLFGIDAIFGVPKDDITGYRSFNELKEQEGIFSKMEEINRSMDDCILHPEKYSKRYVSWVQLAEELKHEKDQIKAVTMIQGAINITTVYDPHKDESVGAEAWVLTPEEYAKRGTGVCVDTAFAKACLLSRVLGADNVYYVTGFRDTRGREKINHCICVVRVKDHAGNPHFLALDGVQSSASDTKAILDRYTAQEDMDRALGEMLVVSSLVVGAEDYFRQSGSSQLNEIYGARTKFMPLLTRRMDQQDYTINQPFGLEVPILFRNCTTFLFPRDATRSNKAKETAYVFQDIGDPRYKSQLDLSPLYQVLVEKKTSSRPETVQTTDLRSRPGYSRVRQKTALNLLGARR